MNIKNWLLHRQELGVLKDSLWGLLVYSYSSQIANFDEFTATVEVAVPLVVYSLED